MASSTIGSYLMKSSDGTTYTKWLDIKDYPDMFGDPNQRNTERQAALVRAWRSGQRRYAQLHR